MLNKLILILFTVGIFLIPKLSFAQSPSYTFAKVDYYKFSDLETLYKYSAFTVDYVFSEKSSSGYFLALFTDNNLYILKQKGFKYDVIDNNVNDLKKYLFVSYPADDGLGDEKIASAGSYFKIKDSQYLLRIPDENYPIENLSEFFVGKLPEKTYPAPKYKTPRITLTPTPTEAIIKINVSSGQNNLLTAFIIALIISTGIGGGVFLVMRKRKVI